MTGFITVTTKYGRHKTLHLAVAHIVSFRTNATSDETDITMVSKDEDGNDIYTVIETREEVAARITAAQDPYSRYSAFGGV